MSDVGDKVEGVVTYVEEEVMDDEREDHDYGEEAVNDECGDDKKEMNPMVIKRNHLENKIPRREYC